MSGPAIYGEAIYGADYYSALGSVSDVANRLYMQLEPLAYADEENDLALLYLCEALIGQLQEVEDLSRNYDDDDGNEKVGWAKLFDLDLIPDKAVPWLAQFVGVTVPKQIAESDSAYAARLKPMILERTGTQRGTVASIYAAAQYYLTGSKSVVVRERTPTPWSIQIRTLVSETPNPDAVENNIKNTAKPGGILLDYDTLTGQDWANVDSAYTDWNDVKASYNNWDEVSLDWI